MRFSEFWNSRHQNQNKSEEPHNKLQKCPFFSKKKWQTHLFKLKGVYRHIPVVYLSKKCSICLKEKSAKKLIYGKKWREGLGTEKEPNVNHVVKTSKAVAYDYHGVRTL